MQNKGVVAVGRRKTAVARVLLQAGAGNVIVDGKPMEERFQRLAWQNSITHPLRIANAIGQYNVFARVHGGGVNAQAHAISHAIARALSVANPEEYRPLVKKAGLLTRDPRMKERKKPGLKRARKAPQYTKR